jgi:hypothetical protein
VLTAEYGGSNRMLVDVAGPYVLPDASAEADSVISLAKTSAAGTPAFRHLGNHRLGHTKQARYRSGVMCNAPRRAWPDR